MVRSRLRFSVLASLLMILPLGNQPAYAGYDGCSVFSPFPSFPGREAVQVSLDIFLAGTCARHDACYRECPAVPYSPDHKNACDLAFLWQFEAWCGAVATAQELADIGFSAEDFLPTCVAAGFGFYMALQSSFGHTAYNNNQKRYCDPCYNGERAWYCSNAGGYFDEGSCSCTILCGDCTVDLARIESCQARGGYWDFGLCTCWGIGDSPVILDLGGNGFHLVGSENGVFFDINGDHVKERIGWTRPDADDAFLVLDRNQNGQIDDGLELFGNAASQPASSSPNGFQALAMFDRSTLGGNGDGKLTVADLVFSELWFWLDANQDGVSAPGELSSLDAWGVVEIDLSYKESRRRDAEGNEFRYRAHVTFADGTKKFAYDVFFTRETP